MSRYQPYPSYKDSGVEWLGDVPEHWGIGLLSSLFSDNKEKNAGLKNSNLLSLSYGNIIQKDIDTLTGLLPESFDSYQIVHPGYIVLRLTDLQNDKKSLRTGFVRETGIITSAYVGLAKKSQSIGNEKYFYLYLHTFDAYKGFYGMGAGVRQGLNFDELKKLKFTLPPLEEQNLIVKYIEKKTAKIDILIAKQQRLIELLGEKRSAMISHAVTKGINPDVPMKDSGVEWLGEVPEHWRLAKIGHYANVLNGSTPSRDKAQYWNEGIIPWIASGKVNDYVITEPSEMITELALNENSLEIIPSGSLLLGMVGQGKTRGLSALLTINATINQNVAAIIPNQKLSVHFAHYYFEAIYLYIREFGRGGNQAALNCELVREIPIVFPDINEQLQIVNYLDNKTAKIDTLIAKARQAIELMKERRTALISAAVTGKIDVRGLN